MAWLRVLYTILGAVVAFTVGALIWPVHARVGLRYKLASILDGAGALYREVTSAALQGIDNEERVRQLDRKLHDLRRGVTQQMDEARSELSFSRFNQGEYQAFVDMADQVRRRLTAMAEDSTRRRACAVTTGLVPSLPTLVETTAELFTSLATAVRNPGEVPNTGALDAVIRDLGIGSRPTARATGNSPTGTGSHAAFLGASIQFEGSGSRLETAAIDLAEAGVSWRDGRFGEELRLSYSIHASSD